MGPRAYTHIHAQTHGYVRKRGKRVVRQVSGRRTRTRTHVSTISGSALGRGRGWLPRWIRHRGLDRNGRQGKREKGVARGYRRTVYLPMAIVYVGWWPLMLHTHRITGPFSALAHGPLLSPWLRRRRVMANTLRIKCILSPSAWWHPYATAPQYYRLRLRLRPAPLVHVSPLSLLFVRFFFSLSLFSWVVVVVELVGTRQRICGESAIFCAFRRDASWRTCWRNLRNCASWLKFRSFRVLWLGSLPRNYS